MAFLDNSGDIILDAVLTDAGRQRMARGEFKIVKFALGDEEINYELFNGNHPSGSAFSDLKIMQTPILEAFTNNTSLMKTKLISFNRNNILYLPIMRVNEAPTADASVGKKNSGKAAAAGHFPNGWVMLADKATRDEFKNQANELDQGIFYGTGDVSIQNYSKNICIDQGIETQNKVPTETTIPQDLVESAYLIKVDHRLLRLRLMIDESDTGEPGLYSESNLVSSFVDDDAIASYYVGAQSLITPGPRRNRIRAARDEGANADPSLATLQAAEAFQGPIGPRLRIHPRSSLHIQQTDSLFDELGTTSTGTITIRGKTITGYKYIDTLINVVGVTTGNTIDLPIRIIKKS